MAFDDAMKSVMGLSRNVDTLAALAALLGWRAGKAPPAEIVLPKLEAIEAAIAPGLLDGLDEEQARFLHATAIAALKRALDFAERPDRSAGWTSDDPVILQAQGKSSRMVTRLITNFARRNEELRSILERGSTFLDVGSGAGWISLSMAREWPQMHCEGIDIHRPALELAAENLRREKLHDRVRFSERNVMDISEVHHFDLAFVPFIFIPEPVLARAIPGVCDAVRPAGWIFVATYRVPEDALTGALVDFQTTMSGGRIWKEEEISALLGHHGIEVYEDIGMDTGINLYAARKQ